MSAKKFLNLASSREDTEEKKVLNISIDGVIGRDWFEEPEDQNTAKNFRNILQENKDVDRINVVINSLGGSVSDGLNINSMLRESDAFVTTKIEGMSASSATIIANAGDSREIADNALMLIHRAWTIGSGNSKDFKKLADDLEKSDSVISDLYASRGIEDNDQDKKFYLDLMDQDIWLTADEALDNGLIDSIIEPELQAMNQVSKQDFKDLDLPIPKNFKDVDLEKEITERDEQLNSDVDKVHRKAQNSEDLKTNLEEQIEELKNELKELREETNQEIFKLRSRLI